MAGTMALGAAKAQQDRASRRLRRLDGGIRGLILIRRLPEFSGSLAWDASGFHACPADCRRPDCRRPEGCAGRRRGKGRLFSSGRFRPCGEITPSHTPGPKLRPMPMAAVAGERARRGGQGGKPGQATQWGRYAIGRGRDGPADTHIGMAGGRCRYRPGRSVRLTSRRGRCRSANRPVLSGGWGRAACPMWAPGRQAKGDPGR